ncbi:MAG: HD domain-containing protein [Spirochaetes bacterium]|nr:HD domain-containing protein [Spirochaetota bacterium]
MNKENIKILDKKLTIPGSVEKEITEIINKLSDKGYECYLVGGSVRDLVLGHEVLDFDFATNARPEHVMNLFRRVIPTGIKHGTVSVLMKDRQYEITTYRADGKYIDGRRPDTVSFSDTLEQDVKRRDFTINGLAYDLAKEQIIDYVNGLEDIGKRLIRSIGDPIDRFSEDGLRPYRACRFAAKLYFSIDTDTLSAIPKTLETAKAVSAERVRDELLKIMDTEKPSIGLEYMRESGLMAIVLPELLEGFNLRQNKYHIYDIYYHSLYSCDAIPGADRIIKFAALLHDIGKPITRKEGEDGEGTFYNHEVVGTKITRRIMKRLKFSNEEIIKVTNLIINHMFHYVDDWTDGAVRRFMRKVGLENLDDLLMLRLADRRGNGQRDGLPAPIMQLQRRIAKVIEEDSALTVRDLDIDGHDIMTEFNVKPGPVIGKILNELLEMVLDDPEANKCEILLSKAEKIYNRLSE